MGFIVKNTTILSPLDLLAPHSCRGCGAIGEPLCGRCKNDILKITTNFCPNCKQKLSTHTCPKCHLPPIYIVGERNSLLGLLIHDFKYNSVRALARPLAELFDNILPKSKNTIIVPLPTSNKHIRERALDHTKKIAKNLAKMRKWQVEELLIRNKNTMQVGVSEKIRKEQAKTAFLLNPKAKINPNVTYLLIDDVWTTGSSVKEAVKILKKAGIKNLEVAVLAVNSLE